MRRKLLNTPGAVRSRKYRAKFTRRQRTRMVVEGAVRRRVALVVLLAPDLKCGECGEVAASAELLEVDHVDGKTWDSRAYSSHSRAARYWREHEEGVPLRALCRSCNGAGNDRRGKYKRGRQ